MQPRLGRGDLSNWARERGGSVMMLRVLESRAAMTSELDPDELEMVSGWWAAANYLTVAQITRTTHCCASRSRRAHQASAAGPPRGDEPDVVMACVGDVPTMETLAAVSLLRERVPELRVRVVNVIDLMALTPPEYHPHGLTDERFERLFGRELEVVVAFHGYARAVHQLVHGRYDVDRFHVRGYNEMGTTTTPSTWSCSTR